MKWTAHDLHSQEGGTAVVTGANLGLGRVVARELARAGAHVVMACRSTERAEATAAIIRAAVPTANVEVAELDLANLQSVRAFGERLTATHAGLDLLVNNAGVMAAPYRRTKDGFELQFGTNHLGHVAVTGLLRPA